MKKSQKYNSRHTNLDDIFSSCSLVTKVLDLAHHVGCGHIQPRRGHLRIMRTMNMNVIKSAHIDRVLFLKPYHNSDHQNTYAVSMSGPDKQIPLWTERLPDGLL